MFAIIPEPIHGLAANRGSDMTLPYESKFKGGDTTDLVAQFQAKGGTPKKLPTHSPLTGQMRFNFAEMRRKYEEEGRELPDYLLNYQEKKARRLEREARNGKR
jgi:hypothetical protein